MASHDVEKDPEFPIEITLVENRAFSKFEAAELKNQEVLVCLVRPFLMGVETRKFFGGTMSILCFDASIFFNTVVNIGS